MSKSFVSETSYAQRSKAGHAVGGRRRGRGVRLAGQPCAGAGYTFKTIVDSSSGLGFDTLGRGFRQLNNNGEVVFRASTLSQTFIFRGDGSGSVTVAGPPTFFGLNSGSGDGAITDDGDVVFSAAFTAPEGGNLVGVMVRDSGGGLNTLQLTEFDPNTDLPEMYSHATSTSPGGIVAFRGSRNDFPDQTQGEATSGYYRISGSGLVTLAEDNGTYTGSADVAPIVNDAGQVAFLMSSGGTYSILRHDGNSVTTVKSGFNGGHEIWMNASGDVIYADATHVYLYSDGITTTLASEDDGFYSLMKPGNADVYINDEGDVAFWADVRTFNGSPVDWGGIYTGPNIATDRVVVYGDTLLGHVAGSIELLGLNNTGQMLFSVFAQSPDPWRALVIATPVLDADFNVDGQVDGADLAHWRGAFGSTGGSPVGDADEDSDVDGADFLVWQRQFGSGTTADAATKIIPEPRAATLLILGLLTMRVGCSCRSGANSRAR